MAKFQNCVKSVDASLLDKFSTKVSPCLFYIFYNRDFSNCAKKLIAKKDDNISCLNTLFNDVHEVCKTVIMQAPRRLQRLPRLPSPASHRNPRPIVLRGAQKVSSANFCFKQECRIEVWSRQVFGPVTAPVYHESSYFLISNIRLFSQNWNFQPEVDECDQWDSLQPCIKENIANLCDDQSGKIQEQYVKQTANLRPEFCD